MSPARCLSALLLTLLVFVAPAGGTVQYTVTWTMTAMWMRMISVSSNAAILGPIRLC